MIWNELTDLSQRIFHLFDETAIQYGSLPFDNIDLDGWTDFYWTSSKIRKCHMQIIDRREDSKIWLMHINIFPGTRINAPILGFDVIAGEKKITGYFFDYSPVSESAFDDHFRNSTQTISWSKKRELPDWAKPIFSPHMIAAGNIREENEVRQLSETSFSLISDYLNMLEKEEPSPNLSFQEQQNFYCLQQKKNPHLHRSLLSMGLSEDQKQAYIENILFQEI